MALEGGPGKLRLQEPARQEAAVRVLVPEELLPPARGQGPTRRGDQLQKERQMQNALVIDSAEHGHPA
jgi:hypothetical protein